MPTFRDAETFFRLEKIFYLKKVGHNGHNGQKGR
jgi:hypothetical protein